MTTRELMTCWITAGLATTTVLASATTAFADHGGSRRYKGTDYGVPVQHVIVHEHSSSAGPAIAGLIGGLPVLRMARTVATDVPPDYALGGALGRGP